MYIHNFRQSLPPHKITQRSSLDWLALKMSTRGDFTLPQIAEKLARYAPKEGLIETRFSYLPDLGPLDGGFELFGQSNPSLEARMELVKSSSYSIFCELLDFQRPVDHLFHVSCTGYDSPSPGQVWASDKSISDLSISHLYHMGCYAALPALRLSQGLVAMGETVTCVHTEFSTLHFNPSESSPELMVIHSLFADGACRYDCTPEAPKRGFRVVALHEEVLPGSLKEMTWSLGSHGFLMTLSPRVPILIKKQLQNFLNRLLQKSTDQRHPARVFEKDWIWAIHPGGPKIIHSIQELFNLSEAQVHASKEVLRKRGNMSSVTLPTIWESILEESDPGQWVLTMGFGPGLTMSAAVLEVVKDSK